MFKTEVQSTPPGGGAYELVTAMNDKPIKVLLIEDDRIAADVFRKKLSRQTVRAFDVFWSRTLHDGLKLLNRRRPDVILLDLNLPDSKGFETFTGVHAQAKGVPIVIMTSMNDETLAIKAVMSGAQDYLLKHQQADSDLLARAIRYAIERNHLVTDLQRHVFDLIASERRFRTVLEKNADGIIIFNQDGIVRFSNHAAEVLFGREKGKLEGEMFGFALIAGETTEVDIRHPNRTSVSAEMRAVEIDWEGKPAYLASFHDLTERKQTECALKKAYAASQEASRAKSEFVANMSHEIRTPMNSILGMMELISETPLNQEQQEFVQTLRKSGNHLLQLMNDMLDLSKIEAGHFELEPVNFDLAEVVKKTIATMAPLAHKKSLKLSCAIAPEVPPSLVGDHGTSAVPCPGAASASAKDQRSLRILLADDSEDNRMLIERYLKHARHQITTAENGKIAVEKFTTGPYDLVFMDMQMPVMDGYAATQAIRAWERENGRNRRRAPIVALTAYALKSDVKKCIDAGCTAHLSKPIRKASLLEILSAYTGPRDMTQSSRGSGGGKVVVHVDPLIADLMPRYLERRHGDVDAILEALERRDYGAITIIGHKMRGAAEGFGLVAIIETSKSLERASEQGDAATVRSLAGDLSAYLSRIELVYG